MGFYFRKVNTEATIVCVLNAEANPVKEQKHYNGIGPCNGSQSKKNFKQDCFRVVYHYHRGRIFGLFCVLKFSLVRWLSNVFLLSQIVVCCLLLSTTSDNISIDTQYFKLYYLCCRKFEHAFGLSIQV